MKFYSIIVTAGKISAILASVVIASIAIPTNFNTLCLRTFQTQRPPRKRAKNKFKVEKKICILHKGLDESLTYIIPDVYQQSGISMVPIESEMSIGQSKIESYQKSICNHMILVILTEELIADPWSCYAFSQALQNSSNIIICYDPKLGHSNIPQYFKDICKIGLASLKFSLTRLGQIEHPKEYAKALSRRLMEDQSDASLVTVPTYDINRQNPLWKYDACLIHTPDDQNLDDFIFSTLSPMLRDQFRIIDVTTDLQCGQYTWASTFNAINNSRLVLFLVTPQLMKSALFEYQMGLALKKGHRSIYFILTNERIDPDHVTPNLKLAFALCRKFYIKY